MEARSAALDRARDHAVTWLEALDERPVPPRVDADEMVRRLGDLPDGPTPAAEVVDLLAEACEPGLVGIPSGRFFGMVIGGTLPAALGADWLTSAWDQNVGLRSLTPAGAAVEEVAGRWLLDLLGLPGGSAVGFVTGATMANFTCLAAARDSVLRRAGYDVQAGLAGGPAVRVIVGEERHPSIDLPLRFLGLGEPLAVPVDEQGRILADALGDALASADGPTIVALQAGNIHSGAFDPFAECVPLAHERGAWVHVDGAFGLWGAVSPRWREAVRGVAEADSWATDAHKTLNVPYDSGLAIVRDADALASSMRNDLQEAAVSLRPELAERIALVQAHCSNTVMLSGSGPTILGIAETQEAALQTRAELLEAGLPVVHVATGPVAGAHVVEYV